MNNIAIFTPVSKRSDLIRRLYLNLHLQSDHNFTWYVIENGSNDSQWLADVHKYTKPGFDIRYSNQSTLGKPAAFNVFLSILEEQWFLTLDSDDQLTNDFIETRLRLINVHGADFDIFCTPRYDQDGKLIGKRLPETATRLNKVLNQPNRGDFSCLLRSSFCKAFRQSLFPHETFISELNFYLWLSEKQARVKYQNLPGYIASYRSDGLSSSLVRTLRSCPRSTALTYVTASQSPCLSRINKLRYRINLWRYIEDDYVIPSHFQPWAIDRLLRHMFKLFYSIRMHQ